MTDWIVLSATLPASPSGLRVRVWRALKATGAGTLRDGVYVLPSGEPTAPALRELARTIVAADAEAHLLELDASDAAQDAAFRALFDRTEAYAALVPLVRDAQATLRRAPAATLVRSLRQVQQALATVRAIDFFPGEAADRAQAAVDALRRAVDERLSPGEPTHTVDTIERLDVEDFQGRTWATRRRPWIDRLATAWLVARLVDRAPTFAWLDSPRRCPRDALGYDFDGARFTHAGTRVSFEVVAASFGLDQDPAVARLGAIVHFIDVGGLPVDEAAGLEAIVRGLQALHDDDEALLAAALPVFDALHAALGAEPRKTTP